MTNTSTLPPSDSGFPSPMMSHQQAPIKKEKNTLAIIALVVAIVGFIFACMPGALLVGWILLPISFILSIISLFMKGKKGLGIAALIVSIVGTIAGVIVFFGSMASAFNDAFDEGEVSAVEPGSNAESGEVADGESAAVQASADEAQGDEGTRANPYPLGTAITQGDWTVTLNSVTLDGTQAVLNENPYNDAPAEGTQYLLANVTATYNGDDPQGEMPFFDIEYVTADGNTINTHDTFVSIPNSVDTLSTLYSGASTTGDIALQVPSATAGEGTFAVKASMLGDRAFVAVQ